MTQPDMFRKPLSVVPSPQTVEPRLWVKRLAIWETPEDPPIQDVPLRPGMNIIWTPDDNGIGHGGGKTLFCRLLRYCLGEDRYAPEEQRDRIGQAFLNGWVGVEVMLEGACWAILRPLGIRRKHYAIPDGNLDEIVRSDMPATGLEPFLAAVEEKLLTPGVKDLVSGNKQDHRAWQIALAWLSRDQECRFGHVLEWRSSMSDSESPARGLNRTEKLEALRAFLNAIDPSEQTLRLDIAAQGESVRHQEQEIGHRVWEIRKLRKQLLAALGLPDDALSEGNLGIEILRRAAEQHLASVARTGEGNGASNLGEARKAYENAKAKAAKITAEIAKQETLIPQIERTISFIRGEHPSLAYAIKEAENFPCPICDVPVDRVLASKCELSHKIPDLEACRARLEEGKKELETEQERLRQANTALACLKPELKQAELDADKKERDYLNLDRLREQQDRDWYTARKLGDDVERLVELLEQQKSSEERLGKTQGDIEQGRERIGVLQRQNTMVFSKLAEKFDPIIRRLIGTDASGEVRLTSKGLDLIVQMGGNRSTSAIDSLKVVAFDLAALCLSIEGETKVPAFFVHDSPREADLGLKLYHGLFHLAHELEGAGELPLFQYIVTTTTRPPEDYAKKPWVVLELRGAPAEERLLKKDL